MGSVVVAASSAEQERFLLRVADHDETPPILPETLFPRSPERLRLTLYALLFIADIALVALAFFAAGALRLGLPFEEQATRTLIVVLPTFAAISLHNGAYSVRALQCPGWGASKTVEAMAYAAAVAIALLFYMKVSEQFSRQIFATGTALAILLVVCGRWVVCRRLGKLHGGNFINRLVIVDDLELGTIEGGTRIEARALGLDPAGDDPILRDLLGKALERCDSVVVACSPSRRESWCHALKGAAVDVELVAPELDYLHALAIGDFGGNRTLVMSARPLNVRERALKRSLDLVIATIALAILSPLMAVTAIAIILESEGPILFRQQRVGHNNRLFRLLKFRSFHAHAIDSSGERSVVRADRRLTRVGRFMRRTSIDELPQLVNVIAGDMSIVGPRPHALGSTAEDALFWEIDARYFHRHVVKPGMTGLAQVRGYRGATLRQDDLKNRLQADLDYLSNWTIWRDVKIIIATFGVLLHPNAF